MAFYKKLNKKGAIQLTLLIAAIGLIVFLAVVSNAPLKEGFLASIFPKDASHAASSFLETFNGTPSVPTPFNPPNWDVLVHTREGVQDPLDQMEAHHGLHCERPINDDPTIPVTDPRKLVTHHLDGSAANYVFNCKDHMMTSITSHEPAGYAVIYLTPNNMVDFSSGEAVIKFDMSTWRSSGRDWVDVWITPFADNLTAPLQDDLPDLQGNPKRAIHIKMGNTGSRTPFNTFFEPRLITNFHAAQINTWFWDGNHELEDFLTPNPARRDTFELRISKTHIKFCVLPYTGTEVGGPTQTVCWADDNFAAPLDFDKGIVQFGHHSYTPDKDCTSENHILAFGQNCGPDTWHWDNISISPSQPFTMIKSDKQLVDLVAQSVATFNFTSPSPQNAFLRFDFVGDPALLKYSINGGQTWLTPTRQATELNIIEHHHPYWTSIPAGVTSVQIKGGQLNNWGSWVKNVAVWSETLGTTPSASPSLVPSIAPSPSPSPAKPGDANGDNKVDIFDYNLVLTDFGKTGSNLPADIDKNGKVDIFDYNIVLTNFGK